MALNATGVTKEEKEVLDAEKKILSIQWCNSEGKVAKQAFYKDKIVIKVVTKNLANEELSISILEKKTNQKVADWDKATDDDVVLKSTVNDDDTTTIEFTPKDEWFSKRAKDKEIIALVSYSEEVKKISGSGFKVKKINYNKDMTVSDNGVRFTAQEEAIAMICPDGKIRAYQDKGCGKGTWTVGYGEAATGGDITKDTVLDSKEAAFDRFKNKLKGDFQKRAVHLLFNTDLKKDSQGKILIEGGGIKRKVTQYEFDALVDLVYNSWSCAELIGKIADEEEITEETFTSFKPNNGELTGRRKNQYNLYTNQITTVTGPKEFYRKDNTNGGYCKIKKEVPETKKVEKNGKMVEEPVYETVDGKQVPKMKTVEEKGWYVKNSTESYTINY